MKILAVSDIESGLIYNPQIANRFHDIDLVVGCGDLPYYYLEYIVSMLNVPLYFVRGNHASQVEFSDSGVRRYPGGAVDLHRRSIRDITGVILAGIEGSVRYNLGDHQYTQGQMWRMAYWVALQLMINKIRFGRAIDILVTHAPPWKIHDMEDLPHHGIKAFNWLNRVFKPMYHLHGHVHVYRTGTVTETLTGDTRVVNTYGYRELQISPQVMMERGMVPKKGK